MKKVDSILTYASLLVYPIGWFTIAPIVAYGFLKICQWQPIFYWVFLAYPLWVFYNRDEAVKGTLRNDSWRRMAIFRYLANYFPMKIHKTSELDSSKCYIFAHFPHGCVTYCNVINFGTEATGVSAIFPGIKVSPLTLDLNFYFPIVRECIQRLGFGSVSAESIKYRLTKKGPGQAVSIVVGGEAEKALTDPNNPYLCKFSDRKGFVKMALKTG